MGRFRLVVHWRLTLLLLHGGSPRTTCFRPDPHFSRDREPICFSTQPEADPIFISPWDLLPGWEQ